MSESSVTSRVRALSARSVAALGTLGVLAVVFVAGLAAPDSIAGTLVEILTSEGTLSAALRLSVPIALAALGGIFSEKSGVINIGLEGLLIISAFAAIYVTDITGGVWVGFAGGVLASILLAALFAVVVIEFRADQIIAGLAVWLIALGLAPFSSMNGLRVRRILPSSWISRRCTFTLSPTSR